MMVMLTPRADNRHIVVTWLDGDLRQALDARIARPLTRQDQGANPRGSLRRRPRPTISRRCHPNWPLDTVRFRPGNFVTLAAVNVNTR